MGNINIKDFVEVTHIDSTGTFGTISFYLCITSIMFVEKDIILREKVLKSITGIIVEIPVTCDIYQKLNSFLYRQHTEYFNNEKIFENIIKKVTDKKKIKKLTIKYNLHLLQKS
jgi:hypothetical protein